MTLDEICSQITEHQRTRVFCIKGQQRCDRSMESFIASSLMPGFNALDEDGRIAVFKQAKKMRLQIEASDGVPNGVETLDRSMANCVKLVMKSRQARLVWDEQRDVVEELMVELAKQTPAWPFVDTVKGLGPLGLAIIIGEAKGPLTNYSTVAKLWKRLGLAVEEGRRQGNPESGATKKDWEKHGYNPKRRAQIWSIIDSMFKNQRSGDKDEDGKNPKKSGKPVIVAAGTNDGPYGKIYAKRRAYEAELNECGVYAEQAAEALHRMDKGRSSTKKKMSSKSRNILESGRLLPAHLHNRALRYMTKELIVDIWRAWRANAVVDIPMDRSEHYRLEVVAE